MNFKLSALTFFFVLGFTFTNCYDDCEGCRNAKPYFDVIGLSATHQKALPDNGVEPIDLTAPIALSDYAGVRAALEVDLIAYQQKMDWNFSTMPSALACSCLGFNGELGAKEESFAAFDIITVFDYDSLHPANSSLLSTMQLKIIEGLDGTLPNELYSGTLEKYLEENAGELIAHRDYILKPYLIPESLDSMQLKIQMTLNNGEMYEALTETVYFQ